MEKEELIEMIDHFLETEDIKDGQIAFILRNQNNEYKAIIYLESDPDKIYAVVVKENEYELYDIYDWDFSIDTHLFEELKDGYEIYHMPIEEHVGVWLLVDNLRYDLNCNEGLQIYLKHCQNNEITPKLISFINDEKLDITDLYRETNIGYEIIANVDVASYSIVLGCRESTVSQYVTWFTTPTRKNGYDMGHYFSSFEQAYKDFEERSKKLFSSYLEAKKEKICSPKEKQYER